MEAENKLYADMHGNDAGQPPQNPPQYTPTPLQQPASQGYPPTTAGAPYYAPPSGTGYGGGYGPPPSAPLQWPPPQQQQVTVVSANSPAPIYIHPVETYTGAMIYSCFIFWCCNPLFGLIGFILAAVANDQAVSDPQGARNLGRGSYIVSSVGVLVSIIFLVVFFTVAWPNYYDDYYCNNGYYVDGVCYH